MKKNEAIPKDNLKEDEKEIKEINSEKDKIRNSENNDIIQGSIRTMAESIRKKEDDEKCENQQKINSKEEIKDSVFESNNDKVLIYTNDAITKKSELTNTEKNKIKEQSNIENINTEKNKIKEHSNIPESDHIKDNNELSNNNPSNNPNNIQIFLPLYFRQESKKNYSNLKYQSDSKKESTLTKKYLLMSFNDKDKTKMIQSMLRNDASDEIIEKIINELTGTYNYIMKNKNGNFFLRDLIKVCKPNHRLKILFEIYKTIADDCTDKFGSHPIQELIDYSNSEQEYNLILYSFNDYNKALLASLDPNGSYVIQKIITHIPEKYKKKFNYLFVSYLTFIVNKKFGVVNAKCFVDNIKD